VPNLFINLPSQAGNGVGAAVDFSAMGASKTIVVSGVWPQNNQPSITIEINNDAAQLGTWAPIAAFQGGGEVVVDVACRFVRARVANFKSGTAPQIDIGGQADAAQFATLVAPAGNGFGAAVDISALGAFKSVHIGNEFRGAVVIEMSTDGITDWGQPFAFNKPGVSSAVFTANFARVRRAGVPQVNPGLPLVNIGATDDAGGGGGGATVQSFTYTVTGLEPDTSDFVVVMPIAQPNDTYEVVASAAGGTVGAGGLGDFTIGIQMPDVAAGDRTTTQFRVVTSIALVAGDQIDFLISEG